MGHAYLPWLDGPRKVTSGIRVEGRVIMNLTKIFFSISPSENLVRRRVDVFAGVFRFLPIDTLDLCLHI